MTESDFGKAVGAFVADVRAELELRIKERDQAIALLDKIQEEHGILIGLWLHRNPDKFPDLSNHINKIALEVA